jgi:hypothetical protein
MKTNKVLYTEQTGSGHVYVIVERTLAHLGFLEKGRTKNLGFPIAIRNWRKGNCTQSECQKMVKYHSGPGTVEAVGCWSRVEDLKS